MFRVFHICLFGTKHWKLVATGKNESRKQVTATTSDLKATNSPPRLLRQVGEARLKRRFLPMRVDEVMFVSK